MGPGLKTLHQGPFTWDPGSGIHRQDTDLGAFMWDLGPGTLYMGPGTLYVGPYYIETSPLICSNWFLYDGELRHERVNNCMCYIRSEV